MTAAKITVGLKREIELPACDRGISTRMLGYVEGIEASGTWTGGGGSPVNVRP